MRETPMSLALASKVSRTSTMRNRIGCVIVNGGRVVGVGCNKPGSSRLSPASRWSRHAEVQALLQAGAKAHGATLYVARLRNDTLAPALAKPCQVCAVIIEQAGIRKVRHT